MWTTLTILVLTNTGFTLQTDTTLAVQRGARLELENYSGDIKVHGWNRPAVRVLAHHNHRDWIEIENTGPVVTVGAGSDRALARDVDYDITVPVTMPVNLSGVYSDITVEGLNGDIKAETVKGDVSVSGGAGTVSLSSVQGTVHDTGSRGKVELQAVNSDVQATDISGDLSVDAVNGDVLLDRIGCTSVEASSVNGSLTYDGAIRSDGHYHFDTHSGDISVAIPENSNLTVSVSTYSGQLSSSFAVSAQKGRHKSRNTFTLGSGSGEMELETFDGTVQLRRPGEARITGEGGQSEAARDALREASRAKARADREAKHKEKTKYKYKEKVKDKGVGKGKGEGKGEGQDDESDQDSDQDN